jgi:hypothetical protein
VLRAVSKILIAITSMVVAGAVFHIAGLSTLGALKLGLTRSIAKAVPWCLRYF